MTDTTPLCVTLPTAAAMLGISTTGIRRLVAAGKLTILKIQGRALIRTADIRALVDGEVIS